MKIFAYLFLTYSIGGFVGGCTGATHQFYLSALCLILALAFYPWKRKEVGNDVR